MSTALLALQDAYVSFAGRNGRVQAVNGVDLAIHSGEAVGLVGESGSGKSTVGMSLLGLQRLTAGRLLLRGTDITGWSERRLRPLRRQMQVVMQDPTTALNPRMTIFEAVAEPFIVHKLATAAELSDNVHGLLDDVGLAHDLAQRLPSQLSGGQLQRAAIARSLATSPDVLVLDEPISALDVSVGAQVLNLLADLRDRKGLSYLFIAHDLHAVAHICDRVEVMYLGRIVERGPAAEVIARPLHPYSKALVASIPDPFSPCLDDTKLLHPVAPSQVRMPAGCALQPRCPIADAQCATGRPQLTTTNDCRAVACFKN